MLAILEIEFVHLRVRAICKVINQAGRSIINPRRNSYHNLYREPLEQNRNEKYRALQFIGCY